MTSPLNATLEAHYQLEVTSLTQLMRVVRRDGTILGFTTMNRSLTYDDGNGSLLYDDGAGQVSALQWKNGIEEFDEIEVKALIDGVTITLEDLRDQVWRGAAVTVYELNWEDLTAGRHNVLIDGWVQRVEWKELEATFKIRSLRSAYQVTTRDMGFTVGGICRKVFGGDDCGYPLLPAVWTGSDPVVAVPDDNAKVGDFRRPSTFSGYDARCIQSGTTVSSPEPTWPTTLLNEIADGGARWRMEYSRTVPALTIAVVTTQSDFTVTGTGLVMPDGFFAQGFCRFVTTGNNVGLDAIEIKRFTASSGRVELSLPAKRTLAASDGIELVAGCLHTTTACTAHGNYLQGLFLPFTPTADQAFDIQRA